MGKLKAYRSMAATFKPHAVCLYDGDGDHDPACRWESSELDDMLGLARQRAKEHAELTGHRAAVDVVQRSIYACGN